MYTTICQQLQSLDIIPYRRTPGYALHLVPAARSLTLTLTMPSAARLGQVLADGCPPHPDAVRVGAGVSVECGVMRQGLGYVHSIHFFCNNVDTTLKRFELQPACCVLAGY